MITIPPFIEPVTRQESARLLEKQWRAIIWLKRNPYAKAVHYKVRANLNRAIRAYHACKKN